MSEKSTPATKKDDVPENFFLASKKDGHQMTVYYSQAACTVLEEWKKQGKGTKNQFISDAIVEYGMAQFGKKLGERFDNCKLRYLSKPQHRVPREVVTALALALLDGKSFRQNLSALCNKITAEDVAELSKKTPLALCSTLAKKYDLCIVPPEKYLWALAFWAVKKGWLDDAEDKENTAK